MSPDKMNQKKILVLNTLYFPYRVGGAERSVQILVEGLRAQGHDVRVLTTTENKTGNNLNETNTVTAFKHHNLYWPFDGRKHGIRRLGYHLIDSYNVLGFWRVYRALKIVKPDVLITNNLQGFSCLSWGAALLKKTPIVHVLRDYSLLSVDPSRERTKKLPFVVFDFFMRWHYKYLAGKVNQLIGISQHIIDEHIRSIDIAQDKCRVLYNPVICPDWSKEPKANDSVRLGYIGRISEEKGVKWLLQQLVQSEFKSKTEFIVAGEGPVLESLKAGFSDYAKFLGKVDPAEFYSKIDLLIVPSKWAEPFGRVVIEAYSYGIPVITTNIGGLPEIIYPPHKTSLMFSPYDKIGLLTSLGKAISNLKSDSQSQALLDYSDLFSVENYVKSLEKIITAAIK